MGFQECVHSESEGGSIAGTVGSRSTCFAALILSSYRIITANSSAQNTCSSSIERLLPICGAPSLNLRVQMLGLHSLSNEVRSRRLKKQTTLEKNNTGSFVPFTMINGFS